MIYIKHRVNTLEKLKKTDPKYGLEIDLRSYKNDLILNHEPFENGVLFEKWLNEFNHKYLILNVKEEGLEDKCVYLMKKYRITNFFFLDQSFPMLIKTALGGNIKTAVRFSSYESIDTVLKFKDIVEWVWIDYYEMYPLNNQIIEILKINNFKICLVSPELQGRSTETILRAQSSISSFKKNISAVCTKNISLWESFYKAY